MPKIRTYLADGDKIDANYQSETTYKNSVTYKRNDAVSYVLLSKPGDLEISKSRTFITR